MIFREINMIPESIGCLAEFVETRNAASSDEKIELVIDESVAKLLRQQLIRTSSQSSLEHSMQNIREASLPTPTILDYLLRRLRGQLRIFVKIFARLGQVDIVQDILKTELAENTQFCETH